MSKAAGHGTGPKGRRAKKHVEEEHENHERWLVSYADMMTLLMALFVVLYAMSQVDITKFTAFADGLATGFGSSASVISEDSGDSDTKAVVDPLQPVDVQQQAAIDGTQQTDAEKTAEAEVAKQQAEKNAAEAQAAYDQLAAAEAALQAALAAAGQSGAAQFVIDERGLVVHVVSDPILFAAESATLEPQGVKVIATMAPTLTPLPNKVDVEGHANSLPVTKGGPWPSNWELSAVRATTVLRQLNADGVPDTRMSATGFSDTEPLVPSTTKNAASINRRVDVVVLSTASAQANALLPSLEAANEGSK